MKNQCLFIFVFLLFGNLFSQNTGNFSYQAVLRDNNNFLILDQGIGVQISIIQGMPDGGVIYSETHEIYTNENGLFTLIVGNGTTTDDFAVIDWSNMPYFLKTEIDPTTLGGTTYTIESTSQLLSVPYALYSEYTNITGDEIVFDDWDKNNNDDFSGNYNDLNNQPDFTNWDIDVTDDFDGNYSSLDGAPQNLGDFSNDVGFITDYTETQGLSDVLNLDNSAGYSKITEVANPLAPSDVATKEYVDLLEERLEEMEEMLINTGSYFIEDIDGNQYRVVRIGNQVWMAENLRVTKYPDGTPIPLVEEAGDWNSLDFISPAYCFYNNNVSNEANTYGALYTWTAAVGNNLTGSNDNPSGIQGVCPDGWHLPSVSEFDELINYLGGSSVCGGMMKEETTLHWDSPNTGATNYSSFTALPSGYRDRTGTFSTLGSFAFYFTTTERESDTDYIYYNSISNSTSAINNNYDLKDCGFSVRCVKD